MYSDHILSLTTGLLLAADEMGVTTTDDPFGTGALGRHLLAAVVFALMGVAILGLCIWIFDKFSPYSFRKEILEDQNTALGIVVGAVLLGISIIIAAAIQG